MTEQIIELRALAKQVRDFQIERDWSDSRLCKEIAHVGSQKTYKRILDPTDDLSELNLNNQLRNYREAITAIDLLRSKQTPSQKEYPDFSNIAEAKRAVSRAMTVDEDRADRLILIVGETGTGKDAVRKNLELSWPALTVSVEANEFWKYRLSEFTKGIYNALNIIRRKDDSGQLPPPPRYPAAMLGEIISALRERKLLLIINEAHHLGIPALNTVKTIINQTPTIVVLEAVPKLMRDVLNKAYEDTIQLVGNRLNECVYLPSPPFEEVRAMLERRAVKFASDAIRDTAAKLMAERAPMFGNWRFVVQCIDKFFELSQTRPIAPEQIAKVVSAVEAKRHRIAKGGAA